MQKTVKEENIWNEIAANMQKTNPYEGMFVAPSGLAEFLSQQLESNAAEQALRLSLIESANEKKIDDVKK